MAKDFERMENSNRSANASIHEVSGPARRVVLLGGIGALTLGALGSWPAGGARAAVGGSRIGFKSVPVSILDAVVVPEGYQEAASRSPVCTATRPSRRVTRTGPCKPGGRPRSATVAIRRTDGGAIGN